MREKEFKNRRIHFYAFSRITRNFLVKYAVKLLVPSSRNESLAHFVDSSFCDDSRADELEHRRFRVREAPNLRAEGAQAQ